MTSSRIPLRIATALAVLALAGLAAVVAVRTTRGPRPDQVDGRSPSVLIAPAIHGPAPLRIESLGNTPENLLRGSAIPRATVPSAAPALKKGSAPLVGGEDARKTLTPEERGSGKKRDFALGRDEVLKERNGVYGFGNAAYGTTIGKGRVDFARTLTIKDVGQPRLSFDLDEVRMGASTLARGGDAVARADAEGRAVSFDRGAVEEKYLLQPDALEQSFVIRSLPVERSDLVVSGRVSTNLVPPPDGAVGSQLAFTSQGREILTISNAVAIDAAGRRLDLLLASAGGKVSITVPASWVAGASLPITIDPLMGGPVTVDASVSSTVAQVNGVPVRVTDVCYNSLQNEWLVVWQEQFGASAFNFDVYAQRVNASGNLVGSAIPVSVTGAGEYEPAVSWAPSVNRYLIAWRQDPADDSSDSDQFIAGRVLNADGTFYTSSFVLDDFAGQDFGPSLAFDGTNWLCVFTNVVSATDTNVIGRFVAADGIPGTQVTFDSDSDLAAAPAVDVASGTYFVAWQKGVSGGPMSVVGRTMSTSGTLLTGITAIDQSTADCSAPDVSADGTQFLVVWQQTASATDRNVVGRRVASSGTPSGNAINIRATTADQLTPRARWSSTNAGWYVVYSDTTNGDADVYGNRVDGTGKLYAANRITSVAVDEVRPVLAWNSATDEMLVCYLFGAATPYQIKAQRVSMDFTAPSIPGAPVATPNPSGTGSFTLSWTATVETGGSGFSNYDLQRSSNGGSSWALIASPTTESYTDTMPFGEYLYRVRASDIAGNNSAYSAASGVVTVDNLPPPEPVDLAQLKADGVTAIVPGGTAPGTGVVLAATVNSLGLLDGFEDGNFTIDPMWTVGAGTWAISTDGNKVLHDGAALDDQIFTASPQSTGSWEYRFRWPTITTGATVNLQAGFYLFLDSAGLGGNGYQVLVTAGAASTKSVSLFRVNGVSSTLLVGGSWSPDTNFHLLRVNRSASGRFDLLLDGVLLGSALDTTYSTAVSTLIRNVTTNGNTLRVDYVRTSSALVARPAVKLQVEVKPQGAAFDGTGLVESAFLSAGGAGTVNVSGLAAGGYHWRARAADVVGNAGPFVSFGTTGPDFVVVPPPAAPQNLSAIPGNAQISLAWNSVSGASTYSVKRALSSGGPYGLVASGIATASYTDGGLQNGTTYFYVISATNPGGEGPNSAEASAAPVAPPLAPSGLSATPGNGQVALSWSGSSGATSYQIKRSTASGGPYGSVGTATGTAFVDGNVANGTTYFYVVSALNAGGESPNSNQAIATPLAPPAPPTGLSAQAGNARVTLSWNVTANATTYNLKRSTSSGGPYATIQAGITGTSATDSGLTNGTSYYYVVSGVDVGGEGGNSAEASATPVGAPAAPTGLVASGRNTQVLLTWNISTGAVSYTVKRGAASGGPYTTIASGLTLTTLTDTGLTNGTSYFYVVSATNAGGESPNSSEASATPNAGVNAPANLTATPGNAQIVLAWSPVTGANSYTVLRSVKAGGPYATIAPAAGPTYTDLGLTNGVAYYYVVHALVGGAESGDSNEASARPTLGPSAPSTLSVKADNGQLTLTWTASIGATSYKVQRSMISGGPYSDLATVSSPGYVDTAVTNGVAYYYVVLAQGAGGESPPSAEVAGIPIGISTSLVATPDATDDIVLTWSAATGPGIAGYNVYRSATTGGPYTRLNLSLLSATTYTDSGLTDAKTFFYVVRVQNLAGVETGDSNEASATTYTSPLGFYGYGVGVDAIDWGWYGPIDPSWTGFVLHDQNERVIATVGPDATDVVEHGLAENTQYTRHIHPLTASGLGPAAPPSAAYTLVHDPLDTEFTISASTPGAVTFTVVPPPNATKDFTGVQFYISTDGVNFSWEGYSQGIYTFQDSFLDPNTLYYYRITYINGDFYESNPSPAKSVRTLNAPAYFFGSALSTTSIQWAWPSVSGAQGYVLHDATENVIAQVSTTTGSSVFYTESGLTENSQYKRHVHAVFAGIPGDPSEEDSPYTQVHAPTLADFTVSATSPTSTLISVVPPPGAASGFTGCEVSRSLDGTTWSVANQGAGGYSFPDVGLVGGTTYFYRIRFSNGSGRFGSFSPSASIITPPGPPAAPPGFTGTALGPSQIHWAWEDVPGASGFVVHDDAHQVIGTVLAGVLAFDESGLTENTRTSRHVHALESGSSGPASNSAVVTTLVHTPTAADFALSVFNRNQINVSVVPPSSQVGLTGCQIEKLVGGTWQVLQLFSISYAFSDIGLQPGTAYQYRIRFRNGDGIPSDPSAGQSATTFSVAPPVITTPSKKTRSTTPIVAGTAAAGESITIFFGGAPDGTVVASSGGLWFYTASPKIQGTYAVVAYGSSSGYSNSITIQVDLTPPVAPAPPTNIRAKAYSAATDLEWDASVSPNVAGYNVYRRLGSTGTWTLLNTAGVILNTRYRDDGLTTGQSYFYRVTAVDNSVNN
jgi:fibronectin type 3 domain-containing protein